MHNIYTLYKTLSVIYHMILINERKLRNMSKTCNVIVHCTLYPSLYPINIQLLHVCKMLYSFVHQYISSNWFPTMGTDV